VSSGIGLKTERASSREALSVSIVVPVGIIVVIFFSENSMPAIPEPSRTMLDGSGAWDVSETRV
jgi:hypothetical protein